MDINQIIESGSLELYALGQLSEQEHQALAKQIAASKELQLELELVEQGLQALAQLHATPPPANLLGDVMAAIDDATEKPTAVAPPKEVKTKTKVVYMIPPSYKQAAAAAVILLIGSLAANLFLFSSWQDSSNALAAYEARESVMAQDLEVTRASYQRTQSYINLLSDPANVKVALKGLELAPEALATVVWNPSTKETHMNVSYLPIPNEGMQYQLWAIKDGVITDAGVFDLSSDWIRLKDVMDGADTFAVTLEKAGGVPSPTLDQMYIAGNVLS